MKHPVYHHQEQKNKTLDCCACYIMIYMCHFHTDRQQKKQQDKTRKKRGRPPKRRLSVDAVSIENTGFSKKWESNTGNTIHSSHNYA